jgi:hypothetical protein
MKFLVLVENSVGDVRKLTVSDTSETCCMQRMKRWCRDNAPDFRDISVIRMSKGCYTKGV